jgi:hypothetical protein
VTRKDENFVGLKLLLVQPLSPDREPAGRVLVAADAVGAGVGDEVFFVRGKEASFLSVRPLGAGPRCGDCRDRRSLDGRAPGRNLKLTFICSC